MFRDECAQAHGKGLVTGYNPGQQALERNARAGADSEIQHKSEKGTAQSLGE